jgi:hypothetical protein
MADDPDWFRPFRPLAQPRQAKPGDLLFEFVRESDRKHFRFEIRSHGESYGWEIQAAVPEPIARQPASALVYEPRLKGKPYLTGFPRVCNCL